MQIGHNLGILATILAVLALVAGTATLYMAGTLHSGTSGPQGPAGSEGPAGHNGANGANGTNGKNGVNGTNGSNGTNGVNGTNGTNGKNGTTWLTAWYDFAPTFRATGTLTYLNVTPGSCASAGEGYYVCQVNITNTCGPESASEIHAAWACADWYYALVNVSFPANDSYFFVGSDPSLGYALGWGQSVTAELWFQVVPYEEYASGSAAPAVPTLTPTISLGFAEVDG